MSKSSTAGGRKGARDTRQAAGGLGAREGGERPVLPDPSRAAVVADRGSYPEDYDLALRDIVGPHGTVQDLASLAGAPDDAKVEVRIEDFDPARFRVEIVGRGYEAARTIYREEGGGLVIHNDFFGVKARLGEGYPRFNGYYTWARFGYNRSLFARDLRGAPPALRKARTVADLMATKAGRDWWKANGREGEMTFDLRPGSRSRKTLASYVRERQRSGTLGQSIGLKLFTRQVRNASRRGVGRIETLAAGNGPNIEPY